jgi:hypothetical protein
MTCYYHKNNRGLIECEAGDWKNRIVLLLKRSIETNTDERRAADRI